MTALERWIACLIVAAAMIGLGGLAVHVYGAHRYDAGHDAGYAAAVAAGNAQRDRDAAAALKTESDLRAQLHAKDADANQKEIEHAQALADAQRRVRAGVDRLRCPAASPIQPATAAADRPASAGSAGDGGGPEIVPDDAAAILSDGAAVAGLVRRYERVIERFEACRAVNAGP